MNILDVTKFTRPFSNDQVSRAEVEADRPFLKALQVGDTKIQNCLTSTLFVFQN